MVNGEDVFLVVFFVASEESAKILMTGGTAGPGRPQLHNNGNEHGSADDATNFSLNLLSPQFVADSHQYYVDLLEEAIGRKRVHNIALSGIYGSGKSSILAELMNNHRSETINISLAPLASETTSETVAKPNKTHENRTGDGCSDEQRTTAGSTDMLTNDIQREIVKQILYSVEPEVIPLSRFHRIHQISKKLQTGIVLVMGIAGLLLFLVAGWLKNVQDMFLAVHLDWRVSALGTPLLVFLVFVAATLVVMTAASGRLFPSQIKAGGVALSLQDHVDSFFDQYLDEIVYFFKQSHKRLVIFEDLDRFENSQIFDSLRELNNILNSNIPQKSKGQNGKGNKTSTDTIRFIYAIKDSVFDRQAANREKNTDGSFARTKFFDVIIPVVAFISHENAADQISDLFSQESGEIIDSEMLYQIAPYLPDMRMLTNIRNEYTVYSHLIDCSKNNNMGLDPTHLLGMLIYKNMRAADFEKIAKGQSLLDDIYEKSREIVRETTEQDTEKLESLKRQKTTLQDAGPESLARRLNKRLNQLAANIKNISTNSYTVQCFYIPGSGQKKVIDESWDFWSQVNLAEVNQSFRFEVTGTRNNYGTSNFGEFYLLKSDLVAFFQGTFDLDQWFVAEKEDLSRQIEDTQHVIQRLRGADMDYLMKDEKCKDAEGTTLQEYVKNLAGDQQLLLALISDGWINRDYLLYTTVFSSQGMTAPAQNFISHHVNQNKPDYSFDLHDDDCPHVLKYVKRHSMKLFSETRLFNISLLDYILDDSTGENDQYIEIIGQRLAQLDDNSRTFLHLYLVQGKLPQSLLRVLAPICHGIFDFIMDEIQDTPTRVEYVDLLISSLSGELRYDTGSQLCEFLNSYYKQISSLTAGVPSDRVEAIASFCSDSTLHVDDLHAIHQSIREAFIRKSLYTYTRSNLLEALHAERIPSLNAIQEIDADIYSNTLRHIEEYLTLLNETEYSLDTDDDHLVQIMGDVASNTDEPASIFTAVAGKSEENTVIQSVTDEMNGFVEAFLIVGKIAPTFHNMLKLFDEFGHADDGNIAPWLSTIPQITAVPNEGNGPDKEKVALRIINLQVNKQLPVGQKIKLVQDLNLGGTLPTSQIDIAQDASSKTIALLMKGGIIDDDADAYTYLKSQAWEARKTYLMYSKTAIENPPQWPLTPDDACNVLLSDEPELDEWKSYIRENLSTTIDEAETTLIFQACKSILRSEEPLKLSENLIQELAGSISGEQLHELITAGLPRNQAVDMLTHMQSRLTIEQFLGVLTAISGEYEPLTDIGRKRMVRLEDTEHNRAILQHIIGSSRKDQPLLSEITTENSQLIVERKNLAEWRNILRTARGEDDERILSK